MEDALLFIGSTVADVVLRTPALPQPGDDLRLTGQQVSLGGCAYNAFSAARITGQHECILASPVGSGPWGDWVQEALSARGVTSAIPRVDKPNGCCYCLVTPDGERSFLFEHGAEYFFRPEWLDALDNTYAAVYFCGLEIEESTGDVLLDWLEKHPPRRLYFAPGPRVCRIPPRKMARIIALKPLFHLSEVEAAQFTRCDDYQDAAALIRSLTGSGVVITLGSRGAYCLDENGGALIPAVPAPVADTIGAGDCHVGAIIAAQAEGLSLPNAVRRANCASAAVVSQEGAELDPYIWMKYRKEE
ncbi:MAG: carbohydrate kinase family protein [Clostridia bacterium]|nr:carbohydrate kinase family protein [Clostridia bacterium]